MVVPNFEYLKAKRIANAREALRDQIARLSNQLPKYKRLMALPGAGRATSENDDAKDQENRTQAARRKRAAAGS